MAKISIKDLKKNIQNNEIKKIYYFTGEDFFLMRNFTKKIFEVSNPNYEKGTDFLVIDEENLNLEYVRNYMDTFPIFQNKKCILISNSNMNSMKKDFYKNFLNLISDIPEFCVVVVQDTSIVEKKVLLYQDFISKISKISEFAEFKHESLSSQKQAILWAKNFDKVLSKENSKFLCEKCLNDLNSIKNLVENVCLSSDEKEIDKSIIERLAPKIEKKHNVYDISKELRSGHVSEAIKIAESLMDNGEDPAKILSVLSSDFVDASRLKNSEKEGITKSELVKMFNYQGKEFKLRYALVLSEKFDVKNALNSLLKAEINMKSSLIPKNIVIRSVLLLKNY